MAGEHDENQSGALLQLVTFALGGEEFGVEIIRVQEIIRMLPITKVPGSPAFVEGVINLRGKVIPVIDLRKRFGQATAEADSHTRVVVMDLQHRVVGFVVDAVREVLRIEAAAIEPPPDVVAGIGSEYIKGMGRLDDRLLILLDLENLLSDSEKGALAGL